MNSIITNKLLEELLPQKDPFVMLSHLVSFNKERIITGFKIPKDCLFIENGVLNESGLLENIAQSIAIYNNYAIYLENKEISEGYIGAINNVKIHKLPKANEFITTEVKVIAEFMGVTMVEACTSLNDEVLVTAKMKTVSADSVKKDV